MNQSNKLNDSKHVHKNVQVNDSKTSHDEKAFMIAKVQMMNNITKIYTKQKQKGGLINSSPFILTA